MKTLKQEIKDLALNQANLKQQRKTVKLTVPRTTDPSAAAYSHRLNRTKLREMNVALGLLKGRSIDQMESKAKTPVNMHTVNALIKKYEHDYRRDEGVLLQSGGTGSAG